MEVVKERGLLGRHVVDEIADELVTHGPHRIVGLEFLLTIKTQQRS